MYMIHEFNGRNDSDQWWQLKARGGEGKARFWRESGERNKKGLVIYLVKSM